MNQVKLLEKLADRLREIHKENLRPAQPEGLWEHHKYRNGLLSHSEKLYNIAWDALLHEMSGILEREELPDASMDLLEKIIEVFALSHDIAKVYGEDGYDHAEKSYEKMKEIIEETVPELDPEIKKIILLMVRFHHLNFDDPQAFAKQGSGYFEPEYFPFVLLAIAADLLSIACDQILENVSFDVKIRVGGNK